MANLGGLVVLLAVGTAWSAPVHSGGVEENAGQGPRPQFLTLLLDGSIPIKDHPQLWTASDNSLTNQIFSPEYQRRTTIELAHQVTSALVANHVVGFLEKERTVIIEEYPMLRRISEVVDSPPGFLAQDQDNTYKDKVNDLIQKIKRLSMKIKILSRVDQMLERMQSVMEWLTMIADQCDHIMEDDDVVKLIEELDKRVDEMSKTFEKYVEEQQKLIQQIMKHLDSLDGDKIEEIFWMLQWIAVNVEITEDGTIIIGDNEYDLDDLIGKCCPFG